MSDAPSSNRPVRSLRIVVVAPHPDDAELGMGGTIARLVAEGHSVHIVDLTNGEPTPRGTPERRAAEAAEADRILGTTRTNLGLPNRALMHTLEARHALAAVLRGQRCEILFAPHPEDAHPDHVAATRIVEDARFDAKLTRSAIPGEPVHPRRLIHYFCTHLKGIPSPTFALDISGHRDTKRAAILAYRSQVVEHEPNRRLPDDVDLRDRFMGSRLGVEAAEPFWCRELLGIDSVGSIV
ncbi:MAG: bacillithiol biosynthesis deacetylase BshB1 [Phycisphaera sp.]|nr:bacillithiol biosynthesis deacetylase BshB1 [Phycisphaera sp.]